MSVPRISILVVDDIRRTTRRYMDAMSAHGIEVVYTPSINAALDRLLQRTFAAAVIDLHMPLPSPFPESLRPYARHFLMRPSRQEKWSTNVGQLVGMLINDQLNGMPPFAYLSAVAGDYTELPHGKPTLGLFDKAKIGANDFLTTIMERLEGLTADQGGKP